MTSFDDMRRELREKYEKLKAVSSNPNMEELVVTPTRIVQDLVDAMDWATLWRWKTAIDKRLERERKRRS